MRQLTNGGVGGREMAGEGGQEGTEYGSDESLGDRNDLYETL